MLSALLQMFPFWGFLFGTAAAAIPFIIHLIYRKRAPKVPFPTLLFLLASVKRTAHRKRLQELLLLAMRSLALFLLALGLTGFRLPGLGGGADTGVGLVFDNSYSMGLQTEDGTLYAAANTAARDIVKRIDAAAVALCYSNVTPPPDEQGTGVAGHLTQDTDRVREELRAADLSYGRGSVSGALAAAEKLLHDSDAPTRFVCVVSDLQAVGWQPLLEPTSGGTVPIVIVDTGASGYRNIAVTAVDLHGKGRAVGVPVSVEAKLLNASPMEQEVPVKLFVDRREPVRRTVRLAPGATGAVSFTVTFERAGPHAGWVEVETQDSLEADNRRYFALRVDERLPVLVVKERDAEVPMLDEAFYLTRALNPASAGGTDVRSVIEPRTLLLAKLATEDLSPYPVVFLLDLPALGDTQLGAVAAFVQRGGTLVVFPGDSVTKASYNAAAQSAPGLEKGLLPATLGTPGGDMLRRDRAVSVAEVDTTHAVLVPFKTLPRATFEGINLWRWHTLQPVEGRPVTVLMALANGAPFLVEGRIGPGRVFMFCCSAGTEWTNFPARVLYQPILHEIVYSSIQSVTETLAFQPGAPVRLGINDAAEKMELVDPLGVKRRNVAPRDFPRWSYAPGIYRWKELQGEGREGAFVINAVPEESDLRALSHDEIRAMLPGRQVAFADTADNALQEVARLRKGIQLWSIVLLIVLAITLAECFMANRPPKREDELPRLRPTFAQAKRRQTIDDGR